jgi:hypothetical protein
MANNKIKITAAMRFQMNGVLDPIEINWLHIMEVCKNGLTEGQLYVILPVEESQDYKPQRRRLITDDKKSPRGLIQRDNKALRIYYPYAAARFDIVELGKYAAERFNSMSRADLERMAEDLISNPQ